MTERFSEEELKRRKFDRQWQAARDAELRDFKKTVAALYPEAFMLDSGLHDYRVDFDPNRDHIKDIVDCLMEQDAEAVLKTLHGAGIEAELKGQYIIVDFDQPDFPQKMDRLKTMHKAQLIESFNENTAYDQERVLKELQMLKDRVPQNADGTVLDPASATTAFAAIKTLIAEHERALGIGTHQQRAQRTSRDASMGRGGRWSNDGGEAMN